MQITFLVENFFSKREYKRFLVEKILKYHHQVKILSFTKLYYKNVYQKFKNLEYCQVCLPYDFHSLDYNNMREVYSKIISKADYLNEADCQKNQGFFLKLTYLTFFFVQLTKFCIFFVRINSFLV
jgi:hypothetical protein